jgi:hypothetical protein
MDENRVYATQQNCPKCRNVPSWPYFGMEEAWRDLIERDRTHASVVWWSACNEAGCGDGNGTLAALWARTVHELDASGRAAGANMGAPRAPPPPAPKRLVPLTQRLATAPQQAGSRPSRPLQ